MKKKLLVIIISSVAVFFVGCGNSMVEKSFEKLKSFIENKEYEKAITSLEMILDKDKENEEANRLYEIIDSYQKAKEAFEENDFEEAEEILDSIDKEYKNYPIKDDIEKLKKDLEDNSNEDSKSEEKDKTEKENNKNSNFTEEQAIAYVVNIYGPAEIGMHYTTGSEGMKSKNGKKYYEVYYSIIGTQMSPGATYYGYNVFEDGTVNKFLDNFDNEQYDQEFSFNNITSSSQLYDSTGKSYSPHKVSDYDSSTTWAEGVGGFGRNEWIQLDLGQVKTIKRLGIVNGLVNSNNGYYKNNRLKEARLEFSDGGSMVINLSDNNSGEQQINLGENGIRTSFIRLVILDAYKGSKFDDTCISTIRAYGN